MKRSARITQIQSISRKLYKYLRTVVKDGEYHARVRNNAISHRGNRMGRFMLVYRAKYSPAECLDLNRGKDRVEKGLEILKTDLGIFPLMERKPSTVRGLVFILFISLIVRLSMRRMLAESGLKRKHCMDKAFLELE